MIEIKYIISILILIILSYLDLKYQKVNNIWIVILLGPGLYYAILNENIFIALLSLLFFIIFSLLLWYFSTIGGADAKILIVLSLFLPLNSLFSLFLVILFFILNLAICSTIYSLGIKYILKKNTKEVPFIPIITLSYVMLILQIFSN